jgi:hypothetical protein
MTPKFCAITGGIKTMTLDPQLAYYLHFEAGSSGVLLLTGYLSGRIPRKRCTRNAS